MYDIPVSTVEDFERKISQYLRRCLGLPMSLSSIALYGQKNRLTLPFSSVKEELMVTRTREYCSTKNSGTPRYLVLGLR